MSKTEMSLLLKTVIIVIALTGLAACALWYPFSISLTIFGVASQAATQLEKAEMWIQLVFYWAASLPCFVILIYYWKIADYIKKDNTFSSDVAKLLRISTKILSVDLIIFFVGNGVFCVLGINDFVLINFLIALFGAFVVALMWVLSYLVKDAALLKEENEGTV